MLSKTLTIFGCSLFVLTRAAAVFAQEPATLALRNGERPAGTLIDLSVNGFTLRSDGRDRRFAVDEVASLEFLSGPPPVDARGELERGGHVLVFRDGQTLRGRLIGVRGARPLRLTMETTTGVTEITSNDVAQVFLHVMDAPIHGAARRQPSSSDDPHHGLNGGTSSVVTVSASQPWTDTGLVVARGDTIAFNGMGSVAIAAASRSGPEGSREATVLEKHYPVAGAPAGALIARVGDATPFVIAGGARLMLMPNDGRLWLGVNDDDCSDNSGTFSVTIIRHVR